MAFFYTPNKKPNESTKFIGCVGKRMVTNEARESLASALQAQLPEALSK